MFRKLHSIIISIFQHAHSHVCSAYENIHITTNNERCRPNIIRRFVYLYFYFSLCWYCKYVEKCKNIGRRETKSEKKFDSTKLILFIWVLTIIIVGAVIMSQFLVSPPIARYKCIIYCPLFTTANWMKIRKEMWTEQTSGCCRYTLLYVFKCSCMYGYCTKFSQFSN